MNFKLTSLSIILLATILFSCNSGKEKDNSNKGKTEKTTVEKTETKTETKDETKKILNTVLFESKKFNFTANFPEKPKKAIDKEPSELGDIVVNSFGYETKEKLYYIAVTEFPPQLQKFHQQTSLIDASVDGLKKGFDQKGIDVLESTKTINNSCNGRHVKLKGKLDGKDLFMTANIFYTNYLYQVYVMSHKDITDEDMAFLNSFKITKPCK